MADEEKTMMEVDETESVEGQETESAPQSPIKKYGIYAAIVLVMIVAAYFVTLKVVKPMFGGETQGEVAGHDEAGAAEEDDGGHGDSHESSDEGHGSGHGEAAGNIHVIRDIIVNPAGTGGTRFLSTAIGFETTSAEAIKMLEAKNIVVRDALISILSAQSIPELSDFNQREKLRKLIQLRVQKLLKTKDISQVYFTEFVLQ